MYIIIWTTKPTIENGEMADHWQTAETLREANKKYKELIDLPYVYTASICGVIESTDYSPVLVLEG